MSLAPNLYVIVAFHFGSDLAALEKSHKEYQIYTRFVATMMSDLAEIDLVPVNIVTVTQHILAAA